LARSTWQRSPEAFPTHVGGRLLGNEKGRNIAGTRIAERDRSLGTRRVRVLEWHKPLVDEKTAIQIAKFEQKPSEGGIDTTVNRAGRSRTLSAASPKGRIIITTNKLRNRHDDDLHDAACRR